MDWLAELIGGLAESLTEGLLGHGKKTGEMPPDEEFAAQFTVRRPWIETIFLTFLSLAIAGGALVVLLRLRETATGVCFLLLGIALAVFSLIYCSVRYEADCERITQKLPGWRKTVQWREVTCLALLEKRDDRSVILAFYAGERLVLSISSPMIGFWKPVKMAEHLGVEIRRGEYRSRRSMRHL